MLKRLSLYKIPCLSCGCVFLYSIFKEQLISNNCGFLKKVRDTKCSDNLRQIQSRNTTIYDAKKIADKKNAKQDLNAATRTNQTLKYHRLKIDEIDALDYLRQVRFLGKGTYGQVVGCKFDYQNDTKKNQGQTLNLALKVINKRTVLDVGEVKDMENELTSLKLMTDGKCTFVVQFYHSWMDEKRIYILMENLPMNSLNFHIHRSVETKGPQSLDFVKFYGTEIALGLEFIHSKHIVHRDLKLDNVCLDVNGHAKLIDFGLVAFNIDNVNGWCRSFAGTLEMVAPEQLLCNQSVANKFNQGITTKYGSAVDWWALGALIYEMTTWCLSKLFVRVMF